MEPMTDISRMIESAQVNAAEFEAAFAGFKATSFAISGTWEPHADAVADLAFRVTLQGIKRLPRRTKKALKKYWRSEAVSSAELSRVRRVLSN